MKLPKYIKQTLNVIIPLVFGSGILWWMYRKFDFSIISDALSRMNWWWMAFSLVFGVTAQVFRGLRWKQTLAPLGEKPKTINCIHAIFLSYASSLLIPRSGEILRCGVLKRYDNTSVSKSLGTVVSERVIDSLLILLIAVIVFILQINTFKNFFETTGINFISWLKEFTITGWIVTIVCCILTIVFVCIILKRFKRLKVSKQPDQQDKSSKRKTFQDIVIGLKAGILSLRDVDNKGLFLFYTLAIWMSYFLHFYLTFFCFDYTSALGPMPALVTFIIGSIAVIVPTPNGMGPWHFAVKTSLVLYGIEATNAEIFVMIVWAIQTALMPLLGMYSLFTLKKTDISQE